MRREIQMDDNVGLTINSVETTRSVYEIETIVEQPSLPTTFVDQANDGLTKVDTNHEQELGKENLDLEDLSYQIVIVFDLDKSLEDAKGVTSWEHLIKDTIKTITKFNLHAVKKIGIKNEKHVFLIIGCQDEILRKYCIENYIYVNKKIVNENTRMSESTRLRVVETMLSNCNKLKYIYNNDYVLDKYPFANRKFEELQQECKKKWFFQSIDINLIKDYFGEEITFYFLFLRFYNVGLGIISVFGFIVSIITVTGSDKYKFASSIFSIALAILSTFFFEIWKRYISAYSWKWNMQLIDNEPQLPDFRPEFETEGVYHQNMFLKKKIFGKKLKYVEKHISMKPYLTSYQQRLRKVKMVGTFSIVVSLVCILPIFTIAIFTLRMVLVAIGNETIESGIGSVINAVFILIFNLIYKSFAYYLTKKEDHRVPSTFNASYSSKIFLFQFVNSFSGLFYIAFIKDNIDLWGDSNLKDRCNTSNQVMNGLWQGCVEDLQFQLFTILLVNFIASLFSELLGPWIQYYIAILKDKPTGFSEKMDPYEKQFYRGTFDTFEEYNQLIIQFSYVSMFAAASPFSPLITFFHNIFEDRVDSYKLINSLRRPNVNVSNGMGSWFFIITLVGMFSVLTNVLLIAFTFPTLLYFTSNYIYILWTVVILEHLIIITKVVLSKTIPDETTKLKKKKAAFDLITKCIIDNDKELLVEKIGIKGGLSSNHDGNNQYHHHDHNNHHNQHHDDRNRGFSLSTTISRTMHTVINIRSDVDLNEDENN